MFDLVLGIGFYWGYLGFGIENFLVGLWDFKSFWEFWSFWMVNPSETRLLIRSTDSWQQPEKTQTTGT